MRGAALLLAAVLASGCAVPVTPSSMAPVAGADVQERTLVARATPYRDADLEALLAHVTTALLTESERASAAPEIVVLRDPTINAFVLPSGRIYLHTGLLARLGSEAQLATILARALAQASRRDALELQAGSGKVPEVLPAVRSTIGTALATDTGWSVMSPVAEAILGGNLSVVYVAAVSGYGRELERTADAGAIQRLVRAGYDPKEAPRTFERLRREAKVGGALERFFLGDDAALAERVESIARVVAEDYAVAAAMPDTVKSSDEFEEVAATVARDNARLELRRGRFRAAQEQLDRAMAVSPSDPQAYLALGELFRLRAQRARGAAERDELTRRALWAYEHSAMLDPALAEVVRELGLLYYQQGLRERALEAFMRYLVLSPDAPDAPRVSEYVAVLSQ